MKKLVTPLMLVALVIFPFVLMIENSFASLTYTITRIGNGSNRYLAFDINDVGQVVGEAYVPGIGTRAFVYDSTGLYHLGTLGGYDSIARAINNNGQIVGESDDSTNRSQAFFYSGGVMHHLGTLGGNSSNAWGINDRGEVVGQSYINEGSVQHGFSYTQEGGMVDLGVIGYRSSGASGINNNGTIVGSAGVATSLSHAVIFDKETGVPVDLGSLPYFSSGSGANAVNNKEIIAGDSGGKPYIYDENGMHLLDFGFYDKGTACDINDHGLMVGQYMHAAEGHAFLYDSNSEEFYDLNDLVVDGEEWSYLGAATAINEDGQIVGYGYVGSDLQAYLLTPVPIPGAVWLLSSGLIGLVGLRGRFKKRSI